MKPTKLSILDMSVIPDGSTSQQAIRETVTMAKLADELGYLRYWLAEHHNSRNLGCASPEVLCAHLAGVTKRIRIGAGGIMLQNHSTLRVAESFRMLETLFPGRIDLGMGRAHGTDLSTASLLWPAQQDFDHQVRGLIHYVTSPLAEGEITAMPFTDSVPYLWLLGSSGQSAALAASSGIGYSFAHFIHPKAGPEAVDRYRNSFKPSMHMLSPEVNVAVFVLCADTQQKASQLCEALEISLLALEMGKPLALMPYHKIRNLTFSPAERQRMEFHRSRIVWGTPSEVSQQLEELSVNYGASEIFAITITSDFADRVRSYVLLSDISVLHAKCKKTVDSGGWLHPGWKRYK